jgi:hypothetical protein
MKAYVSSNSYHLVPYNLPSHVPHEIPSSLPRKQQFATQRQHLSRVKGMFGWGYNSTSKKILEFEGFDEIGVPDHTAIFDAHVGETFIHLGDFLDSFLQ